MQRFSSCWSLPTIILSTCWVATVFVEAQTFCRPADIAPHQVSTWQNQFPFDLSALPTGLCEGTITITEDGGMCVTGKVNYAQLREASGEDRPIYYLTAGEISINGHMISGSGYIWLGPDVFYLYDFISSYIVNGVTYPNDPTIADNLLAASRGTIDGVCLSPAFRQVPRTYKISHKFGLVTKNPISTWKIKEASYTFVSRYFIVYEYHEWRERNSGGLFPTLGELSYEFTNFLTKAFTAISDPMIDADGQGPLGFIPFNVFAPLARLTINGILSTKDYPCPVTAPDDITEAIQIDTEYSALLRAIDNGLFTNPPIPLYFYARFKKVEPFTGSTFCWNETAVILEITGPQQDGENLDAWVDDIVTPAILEAGGTIGLHFGKRIPPNSKTLQAAYEKYASCGVQLNVDPTNCYHPNCRRKTSPDSFVYPPTYYSSDLGRSRDVAVSVDSESDDENSSDEDGRYLRHHP